MRKDTVSYRDSIKPSCQSVDSLRRNLTKKSIGELTTFVSRGITPKYDDSAPGLVINQKCIRNGRLSLQPARHQSKEVPREKLVRTGDVLVNSTGEGTLGRVAQVYDELENCTVDSHVTIVRPGDDVDSYFFGLSVGRLEAYFASQGRGATNQKELSRNTIEEAKIDLPPFELQTNISAIVKSYNDLIANNTRRVELFEQSARLLFEEWFVRLRYPGHEHDRIVDGVPQGWTRNSVRELTAFISRGITPKYDESAPGLVVNQKCIRNGRLSLELARQQSKEVPREKLVRAGDVLVNSTGEGTLGRVAQVHEEFENCTVDSHVTIVRASDDVDCYFFGLSVGRLEGYFASQGRGATNQKELSRATIEDVQLLVAPTPLQHAFSNFVGPVKSQVLVLLKQIRAAAGARDLLLPRLMDGRIEV